MPAASKITPEEGWLLQRERAVAWLRLAFAVLALLVIQLNPARLARHPWLSALALLTFFAYSLAILYLARRNKLSSTPVGVATTCLDVIWIAAIVFSTGGTRTPFFFYYSFPVITASVRWGLRGSIPVALAGVAIYGAVRVSLAGESLVEPPIGMDTFVVRSLYLVVLGGIFGYISEFEQSQNQRLLALSKTASQMATLQERRRIMFELHDGILQSLATMILRLESCRARLRDSEQDLAGEIRELEELTRDSMRQIRQFLAGNASTPLAHGMLLEKLQEEVRFLHQSMGLDVVLESEPSDLQLPADTEREIYYVLREALTNVTRHSHASKVEIHLALTDSVLQAVMTDNGVGFRPEHRRADQGLGLTGMEQRIKKIGGELIVNSSPGDGTKVVLNVPLKQRAEPAASATDVSYSPLAGR